VTPSLLLTGFKVVESEETIKEFVAATVTVVPAATLVRKKRTASTASTELSAGTETKICIIDCSGDTITIIPPHPTWTNEYGKAVVLLDAVVLGGINGLNS